MNNFKLASIGIKALILSVCAFSATAEANLVTNGDFSATTNGNGQLGFNTSATGWSTSGYNFVFAAGTADTSGSVGQYGSLKLWGPSTGSNNGLTASPSGGNFVAADGDAGYSGSINQTINGLVVGQQYTLNFSWATAQQSGYSGASNNFWQVALGGQVLDTASIHLPSHGFSGWQQASLTYTATSATEVLSFLAVGTPSGVPPFALLDGVSLNQVTVPEPESLALLGIGLMGVFGARKLKR